MNTLESFSSKFSKANFLKTGSDFIHPYFCDKYLLALCIRVSSLGVAPSENKVITLRLYPFTLSVSKKVGPNHFWKLVLVFMFFVFFFNFSCIFGPNFTMTIDEQTIEQGTYLKEKLGEKGFQIGMYIKICH